MAFAIFACGCGGDEGSGDTSLCGVFPGPAGTRCGTSTTVYTPDSTTSTTSGSETTGGWCDQFKSDADCMQNGCDWDYQNDACVGGPGTTGSDTGTSTSTGTGG